MLLYEQIVDPRSVRDVGFLIGLSENLRLQRWEAYSQDLESLIGQLRQPGARLLAQPVFEWNGVESPCFRFSLHHALMSQYDELEKLSGTEFASGNFEAVCSSAAKAHVVARRLVRNYTKWTSMPPEYKCSAAPFHLEFLLALVARSLCRQHHAEFMQRYASGDNGVATWKMGDASDQHRQQALQHIEKACGYATLSTLLWATHDKNGYLSTTQSDFEKDLLVCYHHTASYCSSTFSHRLNHAAAVLALAPHKFPDMVKILDLNERLYHLHPDAADAKPPDAVKVNELLS